MTTSCDRPPVVVCAGKDCRKRPEFGGLCDRLDAVATVEPVGCLGLCGSPVVVLDPHSPSPTVLDNVRKRKQHRDVVAVLVDGVDLSDRLRSRQVTGKQRASAIRRMRRRLAR